MSSLIATVSEIQNVDALHIVKFKSYGQTLLMMSLDIDENIQVGTKVKLSVKSSHVGIAKNFSGDLSYSNQLKCTIISCENGALLSNIKLQFFESVLESIITKNSAQKMDLQVGDEVIALIKASELSIGKILD